MTADVLAARSQLLTSRRESNRFAQFIEENYILHRMFGIWNLVEKLGALSLELGCWNSTPCRVMYRPSVVTSSRDVLCQFWADITIKPSNLRARTSSRLDGLLYTAARWSIYSAVNLPRGHLVSIPGIGSVVWQVLVAQSRRISF